MMPLWNNPLKDCFRAKASTTLQKKANSLWRLAKVFKSLGILNPLRFNEENFYGALRHLLESKAGATSGQRILEALTFLDSKAGRSCPCGSWSGYIWQVQGRLKRHVLE